MAGFDPHLSRTGTSPWRWPRAWAGPQFLRPPFPEHPHIHPARKSTFVNTGIDLHLAPNPQRAPTPVNSERAQVGEEAERVAARIPTDAWPCSRPSAPLPTLSHRTLHTRIHATRHPCSAPPPWSRGRRSREQPSPAERFPAQRPPQVGAEPAFPGIGAAPSGRCGCRAGRFQSEGT